MQTENDGLQNARSTIKHIAELCLFGGSSWIGNLVVCLPQNEAKLYLSLYFASITDAPA